ncbi:TrkH family potassium uptake protein, partial [Anaerosalibacter bizertensis]|nr:TrkH family potassium uptake protein [Anaerosalibacter bizertensis]
MNYGVVIKILGNLLTVEALLMIPSLLVSLYYNQYDKKAFLISIFITSILGFIMGKKEETKENIKAKEGLAIVAFGWILASFFGSLPFVLSGSIPSWIDSFFETVSGFTTTGATIVDNVEALPMGILFWRSFTHWIGGMGILVFTIAILPTLGVGGFQIFKVESPGPMPDRIVPKVKDTAKILYTTYFIMTILEIILLLFGGMPLYDAAVHTFGTVGTGGFSIKAASVGAYDSTYIHIIIGIFMILSGVNFSLYYFLFQGKWKEVFKNEELRLYFGIIFSSVILIALNINSEI